MQLHGEDLESFAFVEIKQVDSKASPGSREMMGVCPSTDGMDGSGPEMLSAPHESGDWVSSHPGRMESEEKGKGREPESCP